MKFIFQLFSSLFLFLYFANEQLCEGLSGRIKSACIKNLQMWWNSYFLFVFVHSTVVLSIFVCIVYSLHTAVVRFSGKRTNTTQRYHVQVSLRYNANVSPSSYKIWQLILRALLLTQYWSQVHAIELIRARSP